MPCHVVIAVSDGSSVGESRRAAAVISEEAGLNPEEKGQVAIIVTELATNLAKHARNGRLLMHATNGKIRQVEIVSIDMGPGIKDVAQCLRDGFSTSGSPGNGLGAVRRLSSEFDLYSDSSGTVMVSRVARKTEAIPHPSFHWGAISVPARGELVCGDSWRVHSNSTQISIMMADGLGHGPDAADASFEATQVFDEMTVEEPAALIARAHTALSGTRGAAVAAGLLNFDRRLLKYAGVGNISGVLLTSGTTRGLVSHNGTAGHLVPKIQQFDYPCVVGDILVMHSDGLSGRWDLEKYPGLQTRHPSVIAGVLYRDFTRGRDDVAVVVVKGIQQKAS